MVKDALVDLFGQVDYIARVSNPSAEVRPGHEKLVEFLIKHNHWSPFEMVNVVLDVKTSRDIARQFLRHRSFSFQEFSQRYSATQTLTDYRETRMQDWTNRQSSLPCDDLETEMWWNEQQKALTEHAFELYDEALKKNIAKEVARVILPEGLTRTRMFVNGSIRSWIHYIQIRTGPETQKEHRDLARKCAGEIEKVFPQIVHFVCKEE